MLSPANEFPWGKMSPGLLSPNPTLFSALGLMSTGRQWYNSPDSDIAKRYYQKIYKKSVWSISVFHRFKRNYLKWQKKVCGENVAALMTASYPEARSLCCALFFISILYKITSEKCTVLIPTMGCHCLFFLEPCMNLVPCSLYILTHMSDEGVMCNKSLH